MKLDDLKFWISPLTHKILVGTVSKRSANTANQSRDITGLMVNGMVEFMRSAEHESLEVTQDGKRYRLVLEDLGSQICECCGMPVGKEHKPDCVAEGPVLETDVA